MYSHSGMFVANNAVPSLTGTLRHRFYILSPGKKNVNKRTECILYRQGEARQITLLCHCNM